MSVIADIVSVTIQAASAKVSQVGFGLPLIVSHTAGWSERVREYSSINGVVSDFATSTPEYKAAAALFGQTPRPPKVLIGRAALAPTQRFRLTPVVLNSYTYKVTINGTQVSFTSDASATATEIIAGLKAAIDALGLAITTSDQTTYLRILANAAGGWFNVQCDDLANLPVLQDHADPGIATDLAAIFLERSDWYAFGTLYNSAALVEAAAAWALTNERLYAAQTVDGVVANTPSSGTDDVAEYLANAANGYVFLIWKKAVGDFADFAWLGRCLPLRPGTETWKFKALAGVQSDTFTETQRGYLRSKKCNFYEPTAGSPMTEEGYTSAGSFIDFVRWVDFFTSEVQAGIAEDLLNNDKIPFTDLGIGMINARLRGVLKAEENAGALDAGWDTTVPLAADVSSSDKTARLLTGVEFSATYSGAIHKVEITGNVSQ